MAHYKLPIMNMGHKDRMRCAGVRDEARVALHIDVLIDCAQCYCKQ